jgi:nucleotide-binding universal stress UspA family protein
MAFDQTRPRVSLKSVLYLTDFSEPSEAALPFAFSIARKHGAHLYALHVLLPCIAASMTPELTAMAVAAAEESAQAEVERLDSQLAGVPHDTVIERAIDVWDAVERAIKEFRIELIVLGTHGRTGAEKLLLDSVAEQIFRRSAVPVLTIGPNVHHGAHSAAEFHRVMFATDFTPASLAAAPYAVSFVEEDDARLILLHVMKTPQQDKSGTRTELSVAEAIHKLYEVLPEHNGSPCSPVVVVEFGDPGERILEIARLRHADLVVLGGRASAHPEAVTHLGRATAHNVVAHAPCPVMTVCG